MTTLKTRNLKNEEATKHFNALNLCYEPWGSYDLWRQKYSQPDFDIAKNIIVIEREGEWAGGGTSWFRHLLLKKGRIKVCLAGDLYTLPDHRNHGIYFFAMSELNRIAREKKASLGFGFISKGEIPFFALPKVGFIDIWHPTLKIKVLQPEKLLVYLGKMKYGLLRRFNGITLKITVISEKLVTKTFMVNDGMLQEISEKKKVDLAINSDVATLLKIYNNVGSWKMLVVALNALVRMQMNLKFSLRFIRRLFR